MTWCKLISSEKCPNAKYDIGVHFILLLLLLLWFVDNQGTFQDQTQMSLHRDPNPKSADCPTMTNTRQIHGLINNKYSNSRSGALYRDHISHQLLLQLDYPSNYIYIHVLIFTINLSMESTPYILWKWITFFLLGNMHQIMELTFNIFPLVQESHNCQDKIKYNLYNLLNLN